ncbi:hypothetical protein [Streptosporangium sp. NPDC002524]
MRAAVMSEPWTRDPGEDGTPVPQSCPPAAPERRSFLRGTFLTGGP